mgnify:CR=1 FL=1
MINFEEELEKFQPSMDIEQVEDAVFNNKYEDVTDIVKDPQNHFGKQTTIRKYVNSLAEKHLLSNEKIGKKYIYNLQKNNDYLNRVKHLKHLEDNLLK